MTVSTGWLAPSVGTQVFKSVTNESAWSNPGNVTALDGVFANGNGAGTGSGVSFVPGTTSILQALNYSASIPAGSIIRGIQVRISYTQTTSEAGASPQLYVSLVAGTNSTGEQGPYSISQGFGNLSGTFGSASDNLSSWGNLTSPNRAIVASDITSTFGVGLRLAQTTYTGQTPRAFPLDLVEINVTYSPPGEFSYTNTGAGTQTYTPAYGGITTTALTFPTAGATSGGTSASWVNPNNITASDNVRSTMTFTGAGGTTTGNWPSLTSSGYGFNIPTGSTILGITVGVEASQTGGSTGTIRFNNIQLVKAGTAVGTNKSTTTAISTTESTINYGSTSDLWGTTWTAADINAGNFGVVVHPLALTAGTNRVMNVDSIPIQVTYVAPAPSYLNFSYSNSGTGSQSYSAGYSFSSSYTNSGTGSQNYVVEYPSSGGGSTVQNTGWLSATTAQEIITSSGSWSNLSNIASLDNAYVVGSIAPGDYSFLAAGGFAGLSLPSDATPLGMQVRIEGYASVALAFTYVSLLSDTTGTIGGASNIDIAFSTNSGDKTRFAGDSTNLWGGYDETGADAVADRDWLPSDFNSNLLVGLFFGTGSKGVTVRIDNVQICVWYSTPSTGGGGGTTKSISFAAVIAEALGFTPNRIRSASSAIAEAEAYAVNSKRARTVSENIAEAIAYNIAATRNRNFSLPVIEAQSYAQATSRSRKVSTALAETLAYNINAGRGRAMAFSVSEAESLVAAVYRAKTLGFSIAETEALVASILKVKVLSFTVAEVETLTASISRARSQNLAVLEAMAYLTTVSRSRRVATSVAENEAYALAALRNRGISTNILESESVTATLSRLKQVALALAEVTGYSFSIVKVKLLSAAIIESEAFSFGALRRTRNVAEAINEVTSYAINSRRDRSVALNIFETEVVSAALNRVKQAQVALTETYAMASTVARRREVATTISELEAVAATLGRLKLVAFVSAETESNSFFLSRARKCVVNVNEVEPIQASFNRARSVVMPVAEHEQFTLNFGRLRQQLMNIGESQGINAALNRLREVVQSISNTTDYTFNIRVTSLDPNSITAVVSWQEWKVEGDSIRLINREETLTVFAKLTSDVQIIEHLSADVVVYEDRSTSLTVPQGQSEILIIPSNAL